MDRLIKNDLVKIKILKQLKKKNIAYTASILAKMLGFKFETVQKALEFFFHIGIVNKDIKEHGKMQYVYFELTEIGQILISSKKI